MPLQKVPAVSLSFAFSLLLIGSVVLPAMASGPTGLIVPLYSPPGQEWHDLAAIKTSYPDVPVVAVINPHSGPGTAKDSKYVDGVQELHAAGIKVLGYTWTDYGNRSSTAVKSEISKYKRWYSVDGIFFDAMSNLRGKLKYYNKLDYYVKSHGMNLTVGNAGTDTRKIYIGSVDNIVIYESPGTPSLSYLDGWHSRYDKSNFSFIAYNVTSLDESYVTNATQSVGYMYVTDDVWPNPFDTLASYISELMSVISAANTA